MHTLNSFVYPLLPARLKAAAQGIVKLTYNLSEIAGWTQGESWSLGDSPAIAIAINPGCGKYVETQAPLVAEDTSSVFKADNPVIRIYTSVDSRYILEDFFAKLRLNYGK